MNIYPFLSNNNIRYYENMELVPGKLRKQRVPLLREGYFLTPSVPWEQRIDNGYPNVFYDEDYEEYRCYYTCCIRDDASTVKRPEDRVHDEYNFHRRDLFRRRVSGILLATSKDGLNWTRPDLGVCEFDGHTHTNIILADIHGASVFKDRHDPDPSRRYKMVVRHDAHEKMAVSYSADGIKWCEPIDWPDYNPAGDTHNFAFWDEESGKYVLITRTWGKDQLRLCARCESDDFLHWSVPVEIYRGDSIEDQLYSMPVFKRGEVYYGLGSFFHDGDRRSENFDCVDCELMYSTDSVHWNRVSRGKPFIPRSMGKYGDNVPDSCCIYASAPVERDGKYEFFYFGGSGQHTNFRESTLMCATVDADELAGYAPRNGKDGTLTSGAVYFEGDELYIKADVCENGSLKVMISDVYGIQAPMAPIKGFGFDDCRLEKAGDDLWKVTFPTSLKNLGGDGTTAGSANEGIWPSSLGALGSDRRCMIVMAADNATLYGFGGDVVPARLRK